MTNTTPNIEIQRGPGWMMLPRPLTLLLAFWAMNSPVHSQTPVHLIHDANVTSLVFITAKRENANGIQDVETGTGFIVESRGYVLTCSHLIPEGDRVHTKLTGTVGGRYEHAYPLSIVSSDNLSEKGLTLLKLPEKSWRSVESVAQAEEGAEIVALGFPSDKDLASVSGSITDVDNDGRWLTDAAVSEGMSGGPVFDQSGKLVGIVYGGYPEAPALKQIIPISLATGLLQDAGSLLLPIKPTSVEKATPTSQTLSTSTLPKQLLPGAILEAWVLPTGFDGNSPPGMSLGSMVDSGTLFDLDNFLSEDAFTSLKGSFVGLKWSGFIQIKEKGKYNFVLERDGGSLYPWFVFFKISGQTVISKNNTAGRASDFTQQQVQLDPGFHPFELFTYSWGMQNNYSQHQLRIKIRSENSTLPIPLDTNAVFHSAAPSPTSPPSPIPTPLCQDRFVPGAILEAWVLPTGFTGNSPPGMSMGSLVDTKSLFDLGNFQSEDALKSLDGSFVRLKWFGFIQIKQKGKYNFVLERDGGTLYPWFVFFKISDQTVISKNNPVGGASDVTAQQA